MNVDESKGKAEQGEVFSPRRRSWSSFDEPPFPRRIILVTGTIFLIATGLLVALFTWLSTDYGRARIVSLIEDGSISPGMTRSELVELIGEPDMTAFGPGMFGSILLSERAAPRHRDSPFRTERTGFPFWSLWYGDSHVARKVVFEACIDNDIVVKIRW